MRRKSSLAARLALMTLLVPASAFAGSRFGSCYPAAGGGSPRPLGENRDRLIGDLARRKLTNSCALWASLNKAERYIFLMDTAYLGDKSSRLYPPANGNLETALDHALALYSINGPKAGQGTDGSGRGGMDYNRIFIGFDALGACVLRNFFAANPKRDPEFNRWQSSDDTSGPHEPFNQREMIFWDNWLNSNSLGPQIHHWHRDSDFNQAGVDKRLGLCGVKDPTLTELTVAFDFFHNSNPLGDYSGRGGFGWQIVDKHISVPAEWDYTPAGCSVTPPLNDSEDGGGTFNGLGPARGAECAQPSDNDP